MMNHPIPTRGGAEYDAFTGWRHLLHWKPGERKRIKRRYWRRARRLQRALFALGATKQDVTQQ